MRLISLLLFISLLTDLDLYRHSPLLPNFLWEMILVEENNSFIVRTLEPALLKMAVHFVGVGEVHLAAESFGEEFQTTSLVPRASSLDKANLSESIFSIRDS